MAAANSGLSAQFIGSRGIRYDEVFRDAGEAMLLVDRVVLDCNPAALKLFRADRDQIVGRSFQDLHLQRETADSTRAKDGEILRCERRLLRPDGTSFEAALTFSRVGDLGTGYQLTIIREPSATTAVADVYELLAQRTAQLELVTAELDAFSWSVSHDLRAAIRGIAACSQIVVKDFGASLSADAGRWLTHIHEDSVQLDNLTAALGELSRVSRKPLDPADLDLTSMAREVAAGLMSACPDREVEFEASDGLISYADAALVRTLLRNLLENAWKFTSKVASAKIAFGCLHRDSSGHCNNNIFYVRDNGAGFDMAQAGRLFVAFQRLHGHRDFPGDGIGLATVRRIVHRHGGKTWAEGKPEGGATFFFTLGGRLA
jgi:signal transduction histidine kinase